MSRHLRDSGPAGARRDGFAMLAVLITLLALLALCAPFLMTARNADRAGAQLADRARVRVALDAAGRHARGVLAASHPALDETLDWDDEAELAVDNRFAQDFLDANDAHGSMWDVEARDVAGLVDLGSASPQVLANLLGWTTRLSEPIGATSTELATSGGPGFDPSGELWVGGEIVHYDALDGGVFGGLTRGLFTSVDNEGNAISEGPRPASSHPAGQPVLDLRALAAVEWRLDDARGDVRVFDAPEQLAQIGEGAFEPEQVTELLRLGSVNGGVAAGPRWQHATRNTTAIEARTTLWFEVEEGGWINPGTTIRLDDEEGSEVRLVQRREGALVFLDRVLERDYAAYGAEVSVLARRPVNLNTAPVPVLEALFANLQLVGRNDRITSSEARALADLVVASRPLRGFEDFLRRVVLPAGGLERLPNDAPRVAALEGDARLIDPADAEALYMNGLNANDARLEFATMPYAFRSRDVHELELRAAVNAPSGVLRTAAVRERVELVVPQRELFFLWARQSDFEEELRLSRDAPFWATGPEPTTSWDGATIPPSRFWPNFGTGEGVPFVPEPGAPAEAVVPLAGEHVFASHEDDGFLQLAPSRFAETARTLGRVLHFDHETRDIEGRYLPDATELWPTADELVAWNATGGDVDELLRPLSWQAWVRPHGAGEGILLDVGGTSREADRVTLGWEGPDLVLRVLDGLGDHPDTEFVEAGEVRFARAPGDGPGQPDDTWSHVSIDVRGNRPDQMCLLVDGLAHGVRTLGMSRLAQSYSGGPLLALESTEGFPERGVVRIADELLEYERDSTGNLRVRYDETGPYAGSGGSVARVRYDYVNGALVPAGLATIDTAHSAGTAVELYGYSVPLASNVPAGASQLAAGIGPWRVAAVTGLVDPQDGRPLVEDIVVGTATYGQGLEAGRRQVGLVLQLGDAPGDDPDGNLVMGAFHRTGGYAAIAQTRWTAGNGDSASSTPPRGPLGGLEVVRYSGYTGNVLNVVARGAAVPLQALSGARDPIGGTRVFVVEWDPTVVAAGGSVRPLAERLEMATFCFPISLATPGISQVSGALPPGNDSEFVQITHVDDGELTEWVRYDEIDYQNDHLVRDDPDALLDAYGALVQGRSASVNAPIDPGGGGPGSGGDKGGTGNTGGGGSPLLATAPAGPDPAASAPPAVPPQAGGSGGSLWSPLLGQSELEDTPLSQAVSSALRFRGVFGTYAHAHPANTLVLPVFRLRDRGPDGGRPGNGDPAFLVDPDATALGWPVVVHRGHLPAQSVPIYGWTPAPGDYRAAGSARPPSQAPDGPWHQWIFVALEGSSPAPVAAGNAGLAATDARLQARLVKFPSGERPRVVASAALGTAFDGGTEAGVPSASIDEVVFGTPLFALGAGGAVPPHSTQGGQLELGQPLGANGEDLFVDPRILRQPGGRVGTGVELLGELPEQGGLLRLGDEIVAYESRIPTNGQFTVALGGRGLLGTRPQDHEASETVTWLEHLPATTLRTDIGPDDSFLPVAGILDFPYAGTLLVGDELLHYTRTREGLFEMPRASGEPGAKDEDGAGIFRGRFGTAPAGHSAGTPVILFPFRYWDRWSPRVDAPELAYFGFDLPQPAAWWQSTFWEAEPSGTGSAQLGVLLRTDPDTPWDDDPDLAPGLELQWEGSAEGRELPLGVQADRLQWRVFVRYLPGSFDLATGASHGWKETPRLRRLGVSFAAPGRVLRSVDR